jgi:hypothetical protein
MMAISQIPAHIAQSVEHFLGKEEVTGSTPVVGSMGSRWMGRTLAAVMAKRHSVDSLI